MPKIKLKSLPMQELSIFDLVYNQIECKIVSNIDELLVFDEYMPVVSRWVLEQYPSKTLLRYLANNRFAKVIMLDVGEGANTTEWFINEFRLSQFCVQQQVYLICAGNVRENWLHVSLDTFLFLTGSIYNQIISANHFNNIFEVSKKPYNFLFLNKTPREHRCMMIKELEHTGLLNSALYSNLSENIMLPQKYADFYNDNKINEVIINQTFYDMTWVDGLLNPTLYTDTYFSVVTETNGDLPYRFFTEKIYKPILIGHPFIAVGCRGFYNFLHDEGYKTFDEFIDESFDQEDNLETRIKMIAAEISNLCASDLDAFIQTVKPICEFNRQLFLEKLGKHKISTHYKLFNFLKNTQCQN